MATSLTAVAASRGGHFKGAVARASPRRLRAASKVTGPAKRPQKCRSFSTSFAVCFIDSRICAGTLGYVDDRRRRQRGHRSAEAISVKRRDGKKRGMIFFQARQAGERPRIYATASGRRRCMTTGRTFMARRGRESVCAPDAWALPQFIPQFGQLVAIVLNLQLKTN